MTTRLDHDYVIVLRLTAKRAERWRIEDNRAPVRVDNGKLLTFPTRDEAAQWIKEQEGKQP
jgi:hypothetical protein